ncbi:FAD-linked oxidase C-terminal domain-containing protein [Geminicoccaceae bacterium 1502E]|nr:FAD-linked oxidase C-terminal domain-containing protein [Geminicoccaceae bacterium 1502E]
MAASSEAVGRRVTVHEAPARRAGAGLEEKLRRHLEGEVFFDRFSRGRYATDASIYEIEPLGVVVPRSEADLEAVLSIAREEGVPLLMRGGGTSQAGQTVNRALVVDTTRHLNRLIAVDQEARTAIVQPGLVLDELNRQLKGRGLFFPVDVSTASRATLGGMAANNSAGGRSIRYGIMVHNVLGIDALLADGTACSFGPTGPDTGALQPDAYGALVEGVRAIAGGVQDEIAARFPKVLRRVGGYNLDTVDSAGHNMASLLVGSEGTLALFKRIGLRLHELPKRRVMGICRFPSFHDAMESTRHLVALDPEAVELVDSTILSLAADIPIYAPTVERMRGDAGTDCVLIVEFAGEDLSALEAKLAGLAEVMAGLGFPRAVLPAVDTGFQAAVAEVRKAGLNIVMSMKGAAKPVSFIEDCAVPLEHLGAFTAEVNELFARHGVKGTWYAHASVGCLHVRPVLNLREAADRRRLRLIAEETFALVRRFGGSHSGEHGDGIVRSEFHEAMFGRPLVRAFEQVKDLFDPAGLLNPGKIVRAPRMDEVALLRQRGELPPQPATVLDWRAWGSLRGAAEMCNNNGECRKAGGVMCPSFKVTGEEQHVTRGRANTLRLALLGRLGPDALRSTGVRAALDLCIGCKACRRECPTGVDMARMKTEVLCQQRRDGGIDLRSRLIAFLPRYAPLARRAGPLLNLVEKSAAARRLRARISGFSAERPMPAWAARPFLPKSGALPAAGEGVALLTDCFTRWFEPENGRAAERVLARGGRRVWHPPHDGRPLCCGRTFLAQGLVEEARQEAGRLMAALRPALEGGLKVVGLEPSCLYTLRDDGGDLVEPADAGLLRAGMVSFAEALEEVELTPPEGGRPDVLLHLHCHQRAHGAEKGSRGVLADRLGLSLALTPPGCCGMAGSFGYEAEHAAMSRQIAEAGPLPAVREAGGRLVVADGTSCRHQLRDLAGVRPVHLAVAVDRLLA